MIRSLVTICATALLVVFTAGPVVAGIEVDPGDLSPHLYLEAERDDAAPGGAAPVGNPQPVPTRDTRNTFCEIDDAGIQQCYFVGDPQDPAEPDDAREVTPGDVLRATRQIGLPSLKVQIQPGEKTLVNVDTIFYAEPRPFARSVTLLGFDVDVEAEPVSYAWVHGDGTTATTTTPGKPYPSHDVTHRYRAPADDVKARVDVTYQVRFRVDDGAWQTLGQTLLASGPAAELDVKEAAPVMTRPRV